MFRPLKAAISLERPPEAELHAAIDASVRRYIAECRTRVAPFCRQHFSFAGAWRINRLALGHDLWRAPANVLWAFPHLLTRGAARVFKACGWSKPAKWLQEVPAGFTTRVAREIDWLLYTELLQLPVRQGNRYADRDRLLETVLAHEKVAQWLLPELAKLHQLLDQVGTRRKLEHYVSRYTASRTAASEITSSLLSLAAGAAAFHELTPGALAIGSATATALAQQFAISQFALGPTLGAIYYGLFPATASTALVAGTIGSSIAVLGLLTALSGLVSDPVQAALGIHERRLHRLLTAVEQQMTGRGGDFRFRDAYAARVFDLIDLVKGATRLLQS